MKYVDQSARDLRFYLVSGEVDVAALTILRDCEFSFCGRSVRIGILGASHFVCLKDGNEEPLYEVFACAELTLSGSYLHGGPLGKLRPDVRVQIGGIDYSFEQRLVFWPEASDELHSLTELVEDAPNEGHSYGLIYEFPAIGMVLYKPRTLVHADIASTLPETLVVKTAHCYPNEGTVVFTKTTLSISKKGYSNELSLDGAAGAAVLGSLWPLE
jgi:hypothetical protein